MVGNHYTINACSERQFGICRVQDAFEKQLSIYHGA
jgi:hypothetical protein